jgi:hypothetical protein
MADDNIYAFPTVYGPGLREYYEELMRQPMPARITRLMAQFEAAAAAAEAEAAGSGASANADAPAPEHEPEPSE